MFWTFFLLCIEQFKMLVHYILHKYNTERIKMLVHCISHKYSGYRSNYDDLRERIDGGFVLIIRDWLRETCHLTCNYMQVLYFFTYCAMAHMQSMEVGGCGRVVVSTCRWWSQFESEMRNRFSSHFQ